MHDNYNYNVDIRGTMTSPTLDLSGFSNPLLTFMWINEATTEIGGKFATIIVYYSENGTDFKALDTLTAAHCTKWELYEKAIPTTTKNIRIQAISNYGGNNTFVDYVHVGDRPLFMPSKLAAPSGSIQTRSAQVTWDAYDGITRFELAWGPKGFDPEQSALQEITQTNFKISNLEPQTEYEFCVRSLYPDGQKSDWSYKQAFTTLPSCPPVTDVKVEKVESTSVTLSWTEKGDAKQWEIEWGPSGFTPGTGNMVRGISTNPYTLENLPSASFLEAYVRGVCGEGDTARWNEYVVKFQTECTNFQIPYFEQFESAISYQENFNTWVYQLANPCWSTKSGKLKENGNSELTDIVPSYSSWMGSEFANNKQRSLAMKATFDRDGIWLLTPTLDLGDGSKSYVLQFDIALTYERSKRAGATNTDDDRFAVLISEDNGETWNKDHVLMLWDNRNSENILKEIPEYGQPVTIDLSGYKGLVKIAFYAESTKSDPYWSNDVNDIFIDNFAVREQAGNYMVAQTVENADYLIAEQENEVLAVVSNQGKNPQKDFKVELLDSKGTVIGQSTWNETLYPGETARIPIRWTPAIKAVEFLSARIDVENDLEKGKTVSFPVKSETIGKDTKINAIGNGFMQLGSAPINFFGSSSQAQMIYFEDELKSVGVITALKFSYSLSLYHKNFPLTIRMGTTEKEAFTHDRDWIKTDSLPIVFQGNIDTLHGEDDLIISLDKAFTYQGGNLVVSIQRGAESPSPDYYSTGEDFWQTRDSRDRMRTLSWIGNEESGGDQIGELSEYYPNVVFYIDSMSAGRIKGQVTDISGSAIEQARVELAGTAVFQNTNAQGSYEINRVLSGTYDVKASKFGYFDSVSKNITVGEMEIATVNFTLKKLPTFQIKGKITSNSGESLRGVSVFLEGYQNYEVSTISDGSYTFYNVYAPKTYTLRIQHPDYAPYDTTLTITEKDLVHDIVLNEIAHPAIGFRAEVSENGNKMDLMWESPASMTQKEMVLDDGNSENGMSASPYQNIRVGNLYRNRETQYIASIRVFGEPHDQDGGETVNLEIYDENRTLLACSEDFIIPANRWTEVRLPYMIKVESDYYVMLNWGDDREYYTNYLSADESGNHANDSLIYYVGKDGVWLNMVKDMAAPSMVFMIRPNVFVEKAAQKSVENFNVWKVEIGKEDTFETWNLLTPEAITATTLPEKDWASYEMGSMHKYAIQTYYSGGIASDFAFCREVMRERIEAPRNLRVSMDALKRALFTWDAPEQGKPLSYVIRIDGVPYKTQNTTYTKPGLANGKHRAEVMAVYQSATSESVSIEFTIGESANEGAVSDYVILYPNPAKDHVYIESGKPLENIRILDLNGKELRKIQKPGKKTLIRLEGLPKGLLLIRTEGHGGLSSTRKLIVL